MIVVTVLVDAMNVADWGCHSLLLRIKTPRSLVLPGGKQGSASTILLSTIIKVIGL